MYGYIFPHFGVIRAMYGYLAGLIRLEGEGNGSAPAGAPTISLLCLSKIHSCEPLTNYRSAKSSPCIFVYVKSVNLCPREPLGRRHPTRVEVAWTGCRDSEQTPGKKYG